MRKLLIGIFAASALAIGGCDRGSPTAPPAPSQVRREFTESSVFTLGPYRSRTITVHYDQTWDGQERLESLRRQTEQGFREGNALLDYQIQGDRSLERQVHIDLYAEGDMSMERVPFTTRTDNGLFIPLSQGVGIATCSERRQTVTTINDCVAHNMQHAMSNAYDSTPLSHWRDALHLEIKSQWLLPTAYDIRGNLTSDSGITSYAVHPDQCDTDG